ncbi:hypothetical protein SKAU_G00346460 [Synaphobranchus kaupii]|uniref:Uncharacterized protein n=1 Tax=Synaphobranchus kaupii TaxID=118154 RepID=A0A9Q1EJL4_SYNKA|nr:hypothetical protein SKAU_G00346460 [Synaphobranchus kaupii]
MTGCIFNALFGKRRSRTVGVQSGHSDLAHGTESVCARDVRRIVRMLTLQRGDTLPLLLQGRTHGSEPRRIFRMRGRKDAVSRAAQRESFCQPQPPPAL